MRDLGINQGTLGNWLARERAGHADPAVLTDVLTGSTALWVREAMNR